MTEQVPVPASSIATESMNERLGKTCIKAAKVRMLERSKDARQDGEGIVAKNTLQPCPNLARHVSGQDRIAADDNLPMGQSGRGGLGGVGVGVGGRTRQAPPHTVADVN